MKKIYKGALHIHSTFSDGTSDVKDIARYAKKAGLDWIIITDHNDTRALELQGWYEGVLVLAGEEISPPAGNHYLAFDIKNTISDKKSPQDYIEEVKNQGGFGFVAHPDERTNRKNSFPPLRWSDWDMNDFGGIEIWNYFSDWGDNYDPKIMAIQYLFRNYFVSGPSSNTLRWWDELNLKTEKIIPAVGGGDTHALEKYGVKVFPYDESFKTLTNYIFLDKELDKDFETAKKQVYSAIKSGNLILANKWWNKNSDKINFWIENSSEKAHAGEKISFENKTQLYIELPHTGEIKIIHNGKSFKTLKEKNISCEISSAGKYRFEAYFRGKPWIFSNPIIIC